MSNLDFGKFAAATALVTRGNEVITVNCSRCQGMGSSRKTSPGYCSMCKGEAYVSLAAWGWWSVDRQRDYWQARALIVQAALRSGGGLRR